MEKYIRTRIEQLSDDEKAHDEHDKQWYTRLIQELDWVLMMGDKKPKRNCSQEYLSEKEYQATIQTDVQQHRPFNMSNNWTQDMTGTGSYIYTGGVNYDYHDRGDISHDSKYPSEEEGK